MATRGTELALEYGTVRSTGQLWMPISVLPALTGPGERLLQGDAAPATAGWPRRAARWWSSPTPTWTCPSAGGSLWSAPSTCRTWGWPHYFRKARPYGIQWHLLTHNLLRVDLLHFSGQRLARVISALRNRVRYGAALAQAVESDVWQKRADFAARRVRDDDWLIERSKTAATSEATIFLG